MPTRFRVSSDSARYPSEHRVTFPKASKGGQISRNNKGFRQFHTRSACKSCPWKPARCTTMLVPMHIVHPHQALRDGYLVIGPDTSRDVMTNPIVAKVYTLIYNIMRRTASCGNHTKYLIDLYANRKCLKAAQEALQDAHGYWTPNSIG